MTKPKAKTLQQRFGFLDDDLTTPKHDEMMIWANDNAKQLVSEVLGEPLDVLDITWECSVKTSTNFLIGFIDLAILASNHTLVCFEIKTKIPSLGELLRQINMYREPVNRLGQRGSQAKYASFAVIAPDDRFSPILREQGIEFIKYTG